jgi:hypothetical protein
MQLAARRRADQQARGIRWDRLLQTRRDYVSWTEFYFWARSIMEADAGISDWLGGILKERTPGFIEYDLEYRWTRPKQKSLPWQRLTEWVDEHIFESAHRDGWLEAITFYAARDLRSQRAMAYWRECRALWRRKRPHSYPPFEEWRHAAGDCDCASILRPEISTIVQSSKRASTERFAAEVERYIDWEAFAHWARSPLVEGGELPPEVEQELQTRCPGFLDRDKELRRNDRPGKAQSWVRLLAWGEAHFFSDAKKGGWFDAVLFYAADHPRKVRTSEYWAHRDNQWSRDPKSSYPSFDKWRKDADDYVDETSN